MNSKETGKLKGKKLILPMVVVLMVVAFAVILITVIIVANSHSEIYKMVDRAITNTEASADILLRFDTTARVTKGDKTYRTDTGGVICGVNNMDKVLVSINAVSTTPDNTSSDYNVTASLYSDGENVYDISSGAEAKADITPQEFESIVSEYGLYRYDEKHAKNAVFNENQLEEFKGSGEVTVTLDSPGKDILSAYAEAISEITGEKVSSGDLDVKMALVTYVIYDNLVKSQTYTFSVEYTPKEGDVVDYTISSQISFSDDLNEFEEYDYYKPFFIEEE